MPEPVDAEFEVISGPTGPAEPVDYSNVHPPARRAGDPHQKWWGWVFTGLYDNAGDQVFIETRWMMVLRLIWVFAIRPACIIFTVLGVAYGLWDLATHWNG